MPVRSNRSSAVPPGAAEAHLVRLFRRNGYVRRFDPERRKAERSDYRKGDEVRLVANVPGEVALIRRWLQEAGFEPGRPFAKARQFRVPLYGREAVSRFLAMVEKHGTVTGDRPRDRSPRRSALSVRRSRKRPAGES